MPPQTTRPLGWMQAKNLIKNLQTECGMTRVIGLLHPFNIEHIWCWILGVNMGQHRRIHYGLYCAGVSRERKRTAHNHIQPNGLEIESQRSIANYCVAYTNTYEQTRTHTHMHAPLNHMNTKDFVCWGNTRVRMHHTTQSKGEMSILWLLFDNGTCARRSNIASISITLFTGWVCAFEWERCECYVGDVWWLSRPIAELSATQHTHTHTICGVRNM